MPTENYFGENCVWSVPGWNAASSKPRREASPDYVDCTHNAHQDGFAVRCRPETCPIKHPDIVAQLGKMPPGKIIPVAERPIGKLSPGKIIPVDEAPLAPKNDSAEGKPDMSLLPMDVLRDYVVVAYKEGVTKYERESWRRGFQVSRLIAAAQRHITAFFHDGEDYDPDAEALGFHKHHLAGAIFSLLSILHTLQTRPDLDDRHMILEADEVEQRR